MHSTDLMSRQSFIEQIDSGHLSTEHSLLIELGGGAYVTLLERLQRGKQGTCL